VCVLLQVKEILSTKNGDENTTKQFPMQNHQFVCKLTEGGKEKKKQVFFVRY